MNQQAEPIEPELPPESMGGLNTVALLNRSEIDMQIATAHKYPRSVELFQREAMSLATLSEAVAAECIYALPRDGKVIEGPSARMAEILAYAWGNCRAAARVVDESGEFVTAQGAFHDLEKNVAIAYEVKRRIVDKKGRRFSSDMIGVTANAACSIAIRNAILKGIPKAVWVHIYDATRKVIAGDAMTMQARRDEAMKAFQIWGISDERIFSVLSVTGLEDIGFEQIVTLRGLFTAIKDGDTTPEQAFPLPEQASAKSAGERLKTALNAGETSTAVVAEAPRTEPSAGEGKPTSDAANESSAWGGAPATAKQGDRPIGTPRVKKAILKRIDSEDNDIAVLAYEEVKLYRWDEAELVDFAEIYGKRNERQHG